MFPDPDNKLLLKSVLSQLDGKLNWTKLVDDIGAENLKAAQNRWGRYKRKLFADDPSSPAISRSPLKPNGATPTNNKKSSPSKTSPSKKRKTAAMSNEDDDEEDLDLGIKDEIKNEKNIKIKENIVPETPTRKLPGRRARVTTFKEESDVEDEDVEEEFEDSGHGGTGTENSAEGEISEGDEA